MKNNCEFQYAKTRAGLLGETKIIVDKNELTIDEAIALWNENYPDAAKWIKDGNKVEMVIWTDDYENYSQYISSDAESDGFRIWTTIKVDYPKIITSNNKRHGSERY